MYYRSLKIIITGVAASIAHSPIVTANVPGTPSWVSGAAMAVAVIMALTVICDAIDALKTA